MSTGNWALWPIKLATVWVRLHRARAKFLRELEKSKPYAARSREGKDET